MKLATLAIAENNEGTQINESLDNLFKHNNYKLFDVIVVSDGSEIELDLKRYGNLVKHIKSPRRLGVGASFDVASEQIKTPYMFIMGSDIRFRDDGCVEKMINHLERDENENSLICTINLGINQAAGKTIYSDKLLKRYGAKILFFMYAQDLPPKGMVMGRLKDDEAVDNYRNIIESKWLPKQEDKIYELPCVLGAFYGVRTEWYEYIGGFQGHRYWGTLEPLISLKSWMAGGECKLAPDIETGHLFKTHSSHFTRGFDLIYNKYAISRIVFGEKLANKFIEFLGDNTDIKIAKELIKFDKKKINMLHRQFMEVKVRDIHWFYKKFPFKYYDLIKNIKDV